MTPPSSPDPAAPGRPAAVPGPDDAAEPSDRPAAPLDTIARAVAELRAGRPVVVVDDEDRENEGDLIIAASAATEHWMAFLVRHTSGLICAPLPGEELDRLELPPMTAVNEDRKGTAYAVTTDARVGVTTGISAADRALTVRLLADPAAGPGDFTRPGHVVPLRAAPGGVLERPGHTEAAVDLTRLAGLRPAGALAEVVNDDGTMARLPRLRVFAAEHDLALISIADLVAHLRRTAAPDAQDRVRRVVETRLPTRHGEFTAVGYRGADGVDQVALVAGALTGAPGARYLEDGEDVPVRVHSECLTGDTFGSLRCDCGPQLDAALARIGAEGRGVVLYLRGHEGRGIGLLHKLRAYQLQDAGRDTVDANLELGLPADGRDYRAGAEILADLGVRSVRLITNNPGKAAGLEQHGTTVSGRVPLPVQATEDSRRYLEAKRDRMGHLLPWLDGGATHPRSPV